MNRNFSIWGKLNICAMTKSECIKSIFELTSTNESSSVNLLGIPMAVRAMNNLEYQTMYNEATMTIIDGMPVVKMCRRLGLECERCSGPDIMPEIFKRSIVENKTHYFYGGKDEKVLNELRNVLLQRYPGIRIVGMFSPPFRPLTYEEDRRICDEINAKRPDFIWVGIGAPKQEIWIRDHKDKIDSGVMIGVGAAFNFFSGAVDKAPLWIENCGFEWLYRLIKEPKRLWKRYIIGGVKYLYYSTFYKNKLLYEEKSNEK